MPEQRNAYKGVPPRPWLRLILIAADGATSTVEALADTGNPCELIVSSQLLRRFNQGLTPGMSTNFGQLEGGWLRVQIPELNFEETVLAYGGDSVLQAVQASHLDFVGLAGLPLLQRFEFGGNASSFWIRGL